MHARFRGHPWPGGAGGLSSSLDGGCGGTGSFFKLNLQKSGFKEITLAKHPLWPWGTRVSEVLAGVVEGVSN